MFGRKSSTTEKRKDELSTRGRSATAEGNRLKESSGDTATRTKRSFSGAKQPKSEDEIALIRAALGSSRLLQQADASSSANESKLTEKPRDRKISDEGGILGEVIKSMPESIFGEGEEIGRRSDAVLYIIVSGSMALVVEESGSDENTVWPGGKGAVSGEVFTSGLCVGEDDLMFANMRHKGARSRPSSSKLLLDRKAPPAKEKKRQIDVDIEPFRYVAQEETKVYYLPRLTYQKVLIRTTKAASSRNTSFLSKVLRLSSNSHLHTLHSPSLPPSTHPHSTRPPLLHPHSTLTTISPSSIPRCLSSHR
jgi:CRP-like cAMP-binding protein